MLTATDVAKALLPFGVRVSPGTVKKYEANFLIPRSEGGLYSLEAVEEFYVAYHLIHASFFKRDLITVGMARAMAYGIPMTRTAPEPIVREWTELRDKFRTMATRRLTVSEKYTAYDGETSSLD